jgi:hypothetical protein
VDATALEGVIPDGAAIYVPTVLSSDETGAKRGCCVIAWGLSGVVDRCRLLQRRSLSDLIPSDRDEPYSSLVASAEEIEALLADRALHLRDIETLIAEIHSLHARAENGRCECTEAGDDLF